MAEIALWPAVTMMLKDCAPPGAKIHVFGFNWPSGQWPAHKAPFLPSPPLLLMAHKEIQLAPFMSSEALYIYWLADWTQPFWSQVSKPDISWYNIFY